jgi:hypothetical protein
MSNNQFEKEKNKKAFFYTLSICAFLLIMCFLISWEVAPPALPPVVQEIEVPLGEMEEINNEKITGKDKTDNAAAGSNSSKGTPTSEEHVNSDPNAEQDAAQVNSKTTRNTKITMPNPGGKVESTDQGDDFSKGQEVNGGGTESGGYGPKVIGNRKIVKNHSFNGNLGRATVYAIVKVSPDGEGSFVGFGTKTVIIDGSKPSYKDAINTYLKNIAFDKSDAESTVTVIFKFKLGQ